MSCLIAGLLVAGRLEIDAGMSLAVWVKEEFAASVAERSKRTNHGH